MADLVQLGGFRLNAIEESLLTLQAEVTQGGLFEIPGWIPPKTDWKGVDNAPDAPEEEWDVVGASDLNRIEGNIKALKDRIDAGLFAYVVPYAYNGAPETNVILSLPTQRQVTGYDFQLVKRFYLRLPGRYRLQYDARLSQKVGGLGWGIRIDSVGEGTVYLLTGEDNTSWKTYTDEIRVTRHSAQVSVYLRSTLGAGVPVYAQVRNLKIMGRVLIDKGTEDRVVID